MKKLLTTRILSIVFCVALLFSQCSLLNVFAVDNVEGGSRDKATVITEFALIDETVTNQIVPYGTPLESLILPDTLGVSGYIYNENVTGPVPEAINLENISWTAEPEYNGDRAGDYVFSPVLSSYFVKADTVPSVSVTVEEQEEDIDFQETDLEDRLLTEGEVSITEFAPLDRTVVEQTVPYGTPLQALTLPETLSVNGYIYDAMVAEPVSGKMILENISWTAEPDYDGDIAEEYIFSPVLSSYSVEIETAPSILVTVSEQQENLEGDIGLAEMQAGLEDDPQPLTLDDLIADFGMQVPMKTPGRMLMRSAPLLTQSPMLPALSPVTTYPDTIVIGEDNENNEHTGSSDNDILDSDDGIVNYSDLMWNSDSNYPIEISFTLDNLPAESAYLAIRAYDVDEEWGEKDYVFINDNPANPGVPGESIGYLSGNDSKWNTTVLQIPLSKLQLGKNYVNISIPNGWCVAVDWIQVILDGGEVDTNIEDFSIKVENAVQNGSKVEILASSDITQSGSTEYITEYMLTNEAGDNLASSFGSTMSTETVTLSMPLGSPTGTYTITGLIKDKTIQTIKAKDTITFNFVTGQVPAFAPKVSHTLSPVTFTNGNVSIQLEAKNNDPNVIENVQIWYNGENITDSTSNITTTANLSVSENKTYNFTIKFTRNGVECTEPYSVIVSNIDNVTPELSVSAHKGMAIGDIYVSGNWADDNVVFTLKNSATQLSGTTYKVRARAAESDVWSEWVNISDTANSIHTVSASTLLEFKAVSGSGKESEAIGCTVKIDKSAPDDPVLMLDGTEVDIEAYYHDSEYIVVPAVESDVKQSCVKAQYKLSNPANTESNADDWTDVPESNILAMLEGENTVQLRTIDEAGNVSDVVTYTVNCDITCPTIKSITPANGAKDQSITPVISFTADEPLIKGDGYITIFSKPLKTKAMDIHSSNNRVKLSNQNKTVTVNLPQLLEKEMEYYIVMDKGFVTDCAGNKLTGFGSENTWRFNTIANPVIPDTEIMVLGYTVDLISKSGADAPETTQTVTAVADKEAVRQHNIIAKASYSENGTDKYLKLKITPIMSAVPQQIRVSATKGTATLSSDKKYIELLIPQDVSEAVVTISLGSGTDNQFNIKITNSSYKVEVETGGGITALVEESNLLNSLDLSREIEKAKDANTTVDVKVKMNIERKDETELPDTEEIRQAARTGNLLFLDITLEKVVQTTSEGGSSETETETIKATQQPVVITIDLPENMRGRYNYQIVREHNGVIDIIQAAVIDNGTRLRFEADRFSTYAVAYTARSRHKVIYPDAGVTADTITDVPVIADNTNIESITAESDRMSIDLTKLNSNIDIAKDINTLLPYYVENNEEIIAGFSAVIDGQMHWIAREGKTYWFKYNYKDFADIKTHWARNEIRFTSARELFNGTAPDIFSPDMSMSRGMFVTVMGRMWGTDVNSFIGSSFTDVVADAWYAPYVEWAADAGIVSGYGNGLFGPNDKITREQMAVMITNFADYTGVELKAEAAADVFADNDTISRWAKDAVKTMQKASIINGKPNNCFAPKDTAARAEVAAVLKRFIENAVENNGENEK